MFSYNFFEWEYSVPEAAKLIASDMWESGEIEKLPSFSSYSPDELDVDDLDNAFDPRIMSFLERPIAQIQNILCKAIERGELNPKRIQRDFVTNVIIQEKTYIVHNDLVEWLEQRIELGEVFDDFIDDMLKIANYLDEEVSLLKKTRVERTELFRAILRRGVDDKSILESWKAAQVTIEHLKSAIDYLQHGTTRNDKFTNETMSTRSRRTHQVIIAALCEKAGIDLNSRGAAQKIIDALELKGVSADGNTIRKILKEIPDSLEARQK